MRNVLNSESHKEKITSIYLVFLIVSIYLSVIEILDLLIVAQFAIFLLIDYILEKS